jgi:endonuclease/exonuclease/phosphatase family metal-dependent hydrolase
MKNTIIYIVCLLCVGSLSLASCSSKKGNSLRIMTYNIHNAIGMDEKVDIARVAEVILQSAPDVVAVQEIDSVTERSGKVDVLSELGNKVGMHALFAPAIDFQGGKYGIGILSKKTPKSWKQIVLPGREEARTLLLAEFDEYYFTCVHLSLTDEDRNTSVSMIKEVLPQTDKPVFLAGDWNMEADSPEFKKMEQVFDVLNDTAVYTCPAPLPEACIDYVAVAKQCIQNTPVEVLKKEVIADKVASDHRPVLVEVCW